MQVITVLTLSLAILRCIVNVYCRVFRSLASAACCYTLLSQYLVFTDVYISAALCPRRHMQFLCRSRVQAQWLRLRVACHRP